MTEKGNIEEIFREGLNDFQVEADASVWNAIENHLQVPASVSGGGISVITKTIIGLAAALITGGFFYFNQGKKEVASLSESVPEQVIILPNEPTENLPDLNSEASLESNRPVKSQQKITKRETKSTGNSNDVNQTATGTTTALEDSKTPGKTDKASSPKSESVLDIPVPVDKGIIGGEEASVQKEYEDKASSDPAIESFVQTYPHPVKQEPTYKPFPFKYNIITPNGDGNNDIYYLEADGLNLISVEAFILDAASRRVGFINSLSNYWDGKDFKGNILPNGTYRIIVSATGADGTNYKGQKEIILNR